MGTYWNVTWVAEADVTEIVRSALDSAFRLVIRQMSHWEITSDLSQFNRAPAATWHRLPREFFTVVSTACRIAQQSSGNLDPTLGEIVDAHGHGPALLPIGENPLTRCGWEKLRLDHQQRHAFQPGGLRLDLSAIAKGYAVDLACRYLNEAGIRHFLMEIGGELQGQGCKPDGSSWWVSLAHNSEDLPETLVALSGISIATSGNKFRDHLIDPRDGNTVRHELAAVSVIAKNCMEADAWATALYIAGSREGLRLAEKHRIAALFTAHAAGSWSETWSSPLQEMID